MFDHGVVSVQLLVALHVVCWALVCVGAQLSFLCGKEVGVWAGFWRSGFSSTPFSCCVQ